MNIFLTLSITTTINNNLYSVTIILKTFPRIGSTSIWQLSGKDRDTALLKWLRQNKGKIGHFITTYSTFVTYEIAHILVDPKKKRNGTVSIKNIFCLQRCIVCLSSIILTQVNFEVLQQLIFLKNANIDIVILA